MVSAKKITIINPLYTLLNFYVIFNLYNKNEIDFANCTICIVVFSVLIHDRGFMLQVKVMGSCRTNNFYDLDASRKYALAFSSVLRYLGSESIYAIYTNYESDYKGDFDYLTGVEAKASIRNVGAIFTVPEGKYKCYCIENSIDLPNTLAKTWANVWSDEESGLIERKYDVDYEIYQKDRSVAVFVGIR